MSVYLQPLSRNPFNFKNRLMMSGMTRCRGDKDTGAPNDIVATYYAQRAESASIIVTEALAIHPYLNPWPGACSLFTKEAVEGWKPVINGVHQKGAYIFAQPFHCGRANHPDLANGNLPLAPSAIQLSGTMHVGMEKKPYPVPLEMNLADIQLAKNLYQIAINNAKAAGFDGIEVPCHSGFLLDSFVRTSTNKRTDAYGGSVENRCKLLLEIVDIAIQYFGPERVGVKFSPVGRYNDMFDDNPLKTLAHLAAELSRRNVLYFCCMEAETYIKENNGSLQLPNVTKVVRPLFKNILIANGVSVEEGERRLREGEADMVSFAKNFIGNPDLAERIRNNWKLTDAPMDVYYFGGPKGYIDFPKYQP